MTTVTADMAAVKTADGERARRRVAGWIALAGVIAMAIGAALVVGSGVDADAALADRDIAGYLTGAHEARSVLVTGLGTWMIAIGLLSAGGTLIASTSPDGTARRLSLFGFTTGAGTAILFFSLWMGVVIGLAPAQAAGQSVEAVALALLAGAVNADWVITVMIVGVGAGFMVLSGRDTWAPGWLIRWAFLSLSLGALALVSVAVGQRAIAFVIVPIGLGLVAAASIVAIRDRA
jgi:hypothetical protein